MSSVIKGKRSNNFAAFQHTEGKVWICRSENGITLEGITVNKGKEQIPDTREVGDL
jgi:hypothetical protein